MGLELAQKDVRQWHKQDGSTVTEADLAINAFLQQRLSGQRPDYGWLSEETPDTPARLSCQHLWVVDPIDGTNSFVNGTDGWCVGAALVQGQRPVLGAVFRPVKNEFYWAASGAGAWCNDARITPAQSTTLQGARLLGTGRAARLLAEKGVAGQHAPHIPLLLRLAFVASGQADIALSFGNKNDWDVAAGDMIMHEAGAMVTDLTGQPMLYNKPEPWQNGMLASNRNIHGAVLAQVETR